MAKKHQCFLNLLLLFIMACTLLWAAPGFAGVVRIDNAVSVTVPDGWEGTQENFSTSIPPGLTALFDGADLAEKNLKMAGWKREGKSFPAAFAIIHTTSGKGDFNRLLQAATPEERKRISARFADIVAQKVQQDYTQQRNMTIEKNDVEVLDAGAMTVVLADAVIRDGAVLRTRSATLFFHGESLLQIVTIYDQKYSGFGGILDGIPTTVEWE